MFDMLIQFMVKAFHIWSAVVDNAAVPLNWLVCGTVAGHPVGPFVIAVSLGIVTIFGTAFAYRNYNSMNLAEHLMWAFGCGIAGFVAPFVVTGILPVACVFCGVVVHVIGAVAPFAAPTWAVLWAWELFTTPKSKPTPSENKSKRKKQHD